MATPLFALIVLAGAALYFMTPTERVRLARNAIAGARAAVRALTHSAAPGDPFDAYLRERTRWAVVTPLLVALNVVIFARTLLEPSGGAEALIAWGANFAPRTTNDEWWRLVGSTFVHGGVLHLTATIVGLLPVGLVLERAVGRVALAAVYLAAGVAGSLVSLWTASATSITYGASASLFGVYGLLAASLVWAVIHRPPVPIPLSAAIRVAATAAPFLLYNALTDHLGTSAELAGLGIGFAGGLVIARGLTREKPALARTVALAVVTAIVAFAAALPLRGVVDFRPEIAHIAAVEERTAGAYDAAVGEFKLGRMPAKRLAQLIDRTILPDLQGVRTRLAAVRGVPREQAPLVEAAQAYFELREQSWRRRAEGLLRSNIAMLREAERTERAALDAFQKIQPAT